MLFMVSINVRLPADWDQDKIDEEVAAEGKRGMELVQEGKALRIWRVVGKRANYGIWQADSLEELHENIQSLPLFRHMDVEVTPIIKHPLTDAYEEKYGQMPDI